MTTSILGAESVPVEEKPLLETTSLQQLEQRLEQLLSSEIPAFVVRQGSIAERNIQTNADLRSTVQTTLSRQGHDFRTDAVMPDIAQALQRREVGTGALHQDSNDTATAEVTAVDIHTTTRGAGRVLVANAGPFFAVQPDKRKEPPYAEIKNKLNEMLEQGTVDPWFMEAVVYSADLVVGDNVIFAAFNSYGPVWHRFDTTEAPRIACASEIVNPKQPN